MPYIGNEVLPIGNNPFFDTSLPLLWPAMINPKNLMMQTAASLSTGTNSSTGEVFFAVDTNGADTIAWSTTCMQGNSTNLKCSDAPTYVTESTIAPTTNDSIITNHQ